ncbi:RagB/SusD family nutrient uptake outer membrane protein [Terrimonas sp. NA20]|uniref:RagB/SusD family nutrient uptake outer membrane protein n=1 Tax=Terrimonas ginsenosidimutans TaxID=2908004 RepID=A0ABS9KPY7_9BACT|nr:RagB/SusD family nutrient uptake outer membrane protein [Terrimonas ginsenosidimutans]MCG2614393.1 RagB/SusD family nutrient uptake outer membrane protein [Terrimonas ginsenosidimutans]
MKKKSVYAILVLTTLMASCKKSFIDRPSLDGTTLTNFYNTAEEVRGLTSTLYGLPWSGFENRAMDAIGDVMGGNIYSGGNDDPPFTNFSFAATSVRIADTWKVFYKIGGWTSEYVKALEQKKSMGGNASFIDPAIAECHFFRGVVYFYIARIWGDAPIVTDPGETALTGNFNIPRYFQKDVMRFALEELQKAEAGLPESDVPGRLTKYSAKGMMAKLYLYNKDYANAKIKSQEVIASNKYRLFDNYQGLFNSSANNNNIESLFSIQHQLTGNPWGSGNQKNPDRGPANLQTAEASMWEMYIPSMDILKAYEFGDLRRKGSIMEHGWTYPAWKPKNTNSTYNAFMANGYKYDTLQPVGDGGQKNTTRSNIAKYVVGPGAGFGGEAVLGMNSGINTMILRYADVLLIYAEATLGTNASTSDATALAALNAVRKRANLAEKTSFNIDDILHERRVEFAFEGDFWFDIQRQGYAKAKSIIEAQNRGTPDLPVYVTFSQNRMHLPIPAGEILQDPALALDPVAYY